MAPVYKMRNPPQKHWLLRVPKEPLPEENQKVILKRLLLCIIGDELEKQTELVIKKYCKGDSSCVIDEEHRVCIVSGPDDPWYNSDYAEAAEDLDLDYIRALLVEVAKIEELDVSLIDFDSCAAESVERWRNSSFREGVGAGGGQFVLLLFRKLKRWIGDDRTPGSLLVECTEAEILDYARKEVERQKQETSKDELIQK